MGTESSAGRLLSGMEPRGAESAIQHNSASIRLYAQNALNAANMVNREALPIIAAQRNNAPPRSTHGWSSADLTDDTKFKFGETTTKKSSIS